MNYSEKYINETVLSKNALQGYEGKVAWQCPSNIALIKYWGKNGNQLPMNPSISFTLDKSVTRTKVNYKYSINRKKIHIQYDFEGTRNSKFEERVNLYLESIQRYLPFLSGLEMTIQSENTFPHSAGIASSASSFGALALCLVSIEEELNNFIHSEKDFRTKASFLARLGSGSACRSIFGNVVEWGSTGLIKDSSDETAIQLADKIADHFKYYQDIILIIDDTGKQVSSSKGHTLMEENLYKDERVKQVNSNLSFLLSAFKNDDLKNFTEIIENEALSLHAMMLTSNPGFFLIKQSTIEAIEKIRKFRQESNIPVAFTLDAGPNVHILFPVEYNDLVLAFVKSELVQLCIQGKFIHDCIGTGPVKIEQ